MLQLVAWAAAARVEVGGAVLEVEGAVAAAPLRRSTFALDVGDLEPSTGNTVLTDLEPASAPYCLHTGNK